MKGNAKLLLLKLLTYSHFCLIRPTPEGRVIGFFVGRDVIVGKAFKGIGWLTKGRFDVGTLISNWTRIESGQ